MAIFVDWCSSDVNQPDDSRGAIDLPFDGLDSSREVSSSKMLKLLSLALESDSRFSRVE